MRLTKAFYRDPKTGRSRPTVNYYIEFRDHQQVVRRVAKVGTPISTHSAMQREVFWLPPE